MFLANNQQDTPPNLFFHTPDSSITPPKLEITKYLSNRDLANLAQTSRAHSEFFKPLLDVGKFLHHVVRGEHDAVQAMLEQDISLIFKRGVVRDCSRREFKSISGFEYALWALDKHMWADMIASIPSNEDGRKVYEILLAQYNKVTKYGVTYKLNGNPITEIHLDFENTIIKELQKQVHSINAPGDKDWDAIYLQWREGVGGAQKLLPMHIVYEYCSNEPFEPVPTFTSQPKSSKQFYNWVTRKDENWFSVDSKLSVDFAIFKGRAVGVGGAAFGSRHCLLDLDAMTTLCTVRTNDVIVLESELEGQKTLNNHHQVSQI